MSFDNLKYLTGFGNEFATECVIDALPKSQNNPQKCPYGLYAEQLSGSAFTAPRGKNLRTWLYRIMPSVHSQTMKPYIHNGISKINDMKVDPNQMRWSKFNDSNGNDSDKVDFIDSLKSVCGAGDSIMKSGLAIHIYNCNKSMTNRSFQDSDGDLLIVPQNGKLWIRTELGKFTVEPTEIIVIPRGIKFSIEFDTNLHSQCYGYILETFGSHWELPNLGPIGANGLANPRDFEYSVAHSDIGIDTNDSGIVEHEVINKYGDHLFSFILDRSPYDVIAWHGNYAPFKYDLKKYCTMNTVSYDHPDPSIYTVLTCSSEEEGTAAADFVVFPPRWMVADHTFRPPYFHRNCMSEFMGMIYGAYDGKQATSATKKKGFEPGGASLHPIMSAHGPDSTTTEAASNADLKPVYFDKGMAFMFESKYLLKVSEYALNSDARQIAYQDCWAGMKRTLSEK